GYHAIEFLLWGQDTSSDGPGTRPWQDYLTDMEATAPNGDRRGQFLKLAAEILVEDLATLVDAWAPGADNYRKAFTEGDPDEALRKIVTAIGILSKGELAGERMDVALDSLDQEDEHSCFSDNTHIDIKMNALGIQNVYLGRYDYYDGPGLNDLVAAADPALNDAMIDLLEKSLVAIEAIPVPFDQALGAQGSDGWNKIDAAVNALFDQGDQLVEVAAALGLGAISVDLPE
ncbi:MAG: iron-regulated protein, partial [Myxococcales bacterium]|nr:iron-regulated protein [Myxococcales bacterium]